MGIKEAYIQQYLHTMSEANNETQNFSSHKPYYSYSLYIYTNHENVLIQFCSYVF